MNRAFRAFRLFLIWEFQVSLLSNVRPKYFISEQTGIEILFIVTCGHVSLFSVNVMNEDLDSFILIFHRIVHRWI